MQVFPDIREELLSPSSGWLNWVIPLLGGVKIPKTSPLECFENRKILAGVNHRLSSIVVNCVTTWACKTETEKEERNIHTYIRVYT